MTVQVFIMGLLIHWMADFCLQTHEQAMNKWNKADALFGHTATYTLVWLIVMLALPIQGWQAFGFVMITFISHSITDCGTSHMTHKLFEKKDYHNGFVVIGFDQILHYLQLFFTAKVLDII